jgi:prepilin-type processing-associated H-X9-DG protein
MMIPARQPGKRNVAVFLVATGLLLCNLAAVGTTGRERAKRAVCLANLRQLMSAWIAYADQNDGKIVNGVGGIHYIGVGGSIERAWVGKGWGDNWDNDNVANTGVPEAWKKKAIRDGALWPLVGDECCYKCPVGRPYEWVNYSIVDAMNGLARAGTYTTQEAYPYTVGRKIGETVLWIENTGEIVSPPAAERMVFIDEGAMTPAAFAVHYQGNGTWWDDPPARHNDGATVSWADGHATYLQWQAAETIEFGRRAANRYYGGFRPVTEEGIKDLDDFRRAVWGRLPNE